MRKVKKKKVGRVGMHEEAVCLVVGEGKKEERHEEGSGVIEVGR